MRSAPSRLSLVRPSSADDAAVTRKAHSLSCDSIRRSVATSSGLSSTTRTWIASVVMSISSQQPGQPRDVEPVAREHLKRGDEAGEVDRLLDIAVRAQPIALLHIL